MTDIEDWLTQATDPQGTLTQKHAAFNHLVKKYQDMAFGCAYAILGDFSQAEDAAQEGFLAAWQHLEQLKSPAAFPGWLRRIVTTQCHRQTRNRCVNALSLTAIASVPAAGNLTDQAEQREMRDKVQAAIGQLPEGERIVVILFYLDEYSRREVAAFLNISEIAVKKRLASARKRLHERMISAMEDTLNQQRPSHDEDFARKVYQFTLGFSLLIDSGESIVRSLLTLAVQQEDSQFQHVLTQVRLDIEQGLDLSDALSKHLQFFHPQYVSQVRMGEQSDLRAALYSLAERN